ncbi:hypothetical protein THAOC_11938 [Thalassiosira oceanica]|uniref:Uncharacterized protein n=1 Tax=Thalassiosira oceanica TaxID=159749 RepID=K0SQ11_THAOC|nr:hypothetical protein THAOC_11938 [Thalassiosira oceanica]|eukprot:EJK67074.1 hypothetical protein THAOC_11938 [Thalassiosira oceanica]
MLRLGLPVRALDPTSRRVVVSAVRPPQGEANRPCEGLPRQPLAGRPRGRLRLPWSGHGPLCKEDIAETLKSVGGDIQASFPDLEPNAFGFTADDPIEPNRVWYFVRPRGTFSGKPFKHPVVGDIEATGAKVVAPTEARSMVFDDEGKIKHVSVGYVVDRFTGDTTGGKGAVFGLYHVMGQEIDATIGSPVTCFLQRLPDFLPEGTLPRSYSKEEDIPAWWTDERRGADA